MPLDDLLYQSLESLIRQHLQTAEDEPTTALIRRLRSARVRGYLTRTELRAIGNWKSPRAIRQISANSAYRVRRATEAALSTRSERARLHALLTIRGVSVPMASSILTLLYPRRYGVLDIRVWQLLHGVGVVTRAPNGVGFTYDNWREFLAIVRSFAKKHGVKARDIERALFEAHRHHQKGRLYDRLPPATTPD